MSAATKSVMNDLGFNATLTCAISVSDLKQSIAWYQDMLGLELMYQVDEVGWCEMHSPVAGVTVGLSEVESVQADGTGTTLTWGVTDVEATRAALESKGVRFDGETQVMPDLVKLAAFFDPDNNAHMLAQSLLSD